MSVGRNKRLKKSKRLRVIQITGFRGVLSAIFFVSCMAAGFVGFPTLVLYKIWNYFAAQTYILPQISMFQGLLLWGILAVSYMIINEKNRYFVAFEPKTISGKDITEIMKQIKAQAGEFSENDSFVKNQDNNLSDEEEKKEDKV